jgi:hypothetical protein
VRDSARRLLITIFTGVLTLACHSDDQHELERLRSENDAKAAELQAARTKIDSLQARVAEAEKRLATPTREDIEGILSRSQLVCCRVSGEFDAVLISSTDEYGRKLISSGLAVIRNGGIWPATSRDERWTPLGSYDAADGWPPESAKPVFWHVRPGDRRVLAVKGISRTSDATAVVDFEWRWIYNAIGLALEKGPLWMDDTYHARAVIQRFDDGWRVERVELGERR